MTASACAESRVRRYCQHATGGESVNQALTLLTVPVVVTLLGTAGCQMRGGAASPPLGTTPGLQSDTPAGGAASAPPTTPVAAPAPGRPTASMTTIHLPGRPDMTPEQYAAWWAGVPVERLRLTGPDRAFMPPELAPPDGIVRRTWRVTPEDGAPSGNAQTCLVHVYLPSGWVSAAPIGPLRAATGRPITEADAEGLVGEFMASRGFSPDLLGSPRARKQGDDGKGRTTLVVVEFAGVLSGEGSAQVTVDLVAGVVGSAALNLPGPAPSSRPRKPDLSLKQASSALESELVSRGMGDYELQSGREWHPPYEASLDAAYFIFVVDRRYARPGAAVRMLLREHWYVNGITGTVHREDELPALKEMMEATYRAGEERNRAAAGPSPAPTP